MHLMNLTTMLTSFLTGVFGCLGIVAVLMIGQRYLKPSTYKAAGEIVDQQDKTISKLQKDIFNMQEAMRIQEKRISRAEVEAQRKERLLMAARQEISYFEDVLAILIPALTALTPENKKRADTILANLRDYRSRCAQEQMEREQTRDALSIYLDGVIVSPPPDHKGE